MARTRGCSNIPFRVSSRWLPADHPAVKPLVCGGMNSTGEMNYAIPNFRSRCSTPMLIEVNGKVTANSNAIGTREGAQGPARAVGALLRRHLAIAARAVAATATVAAARHGLRSHDSQGGSHLPLWPEPFQIYSIQVAMSGVGSYGRYGNTHNHQREAQVPLGLPSECILSGILHLKDGRKYR
jgi:hypothetical protein